MANTSLNLHRILCNILLLLSMLYFSIAKADITFTETAVNGFPVVSSSKNAVFVVDAHDSEVVTTVANCVIQDIKIVTGKTLLLQHELKSGDYPIIAGTLGNSTIIDNLLKDGKIDTTSVTDRWEAYTLQLIKNPTEGIEEALVIIGGTPRGTAYGLFEISRRIGVSPYIWWADVEPAPMNAIYASGDRTEVEAPSVKYRGLFINDEDWALLPWAKKTIDTSCNNIGPNTYNKVMELLLRLRANCLWPAKHGSSKAFWSMEENKRLAKAWAIVMSSGDSMLRDNLWEWPRFKSGNNSSNFTFANNPEGCFDYWAKRAGEARDYEGIYDIGMRGLQDVALLGYEGQEAQLAGLKDIIECQRKIITDSLGGDPTKVPQIYIPYKEALTLYNAGLKIPDDVTLCWVDDNYAYIRQLPTATEQKRSGGNGIYYHLSYLGNPCSYIWLSTISPSLISYELCKAYENGMQRFWMINVGDIKPAEVEFEFCMELAWNVKSWTPENAWKFNRWWAAKTFGEDLADEMADIRLEHYRLAAQSKPETVREVVFTHEKMKQRILDYQNLTRRVQNLEASIPTRLKDAYFELFTYPIVATADMNIKLLGANLSFWYAGMGDRHNSMQYAALSRTSYDNIVYLTDYFNSTLASGKWNGIMSMRPNASMTSQFGPVYAATSNEVNDVQGEMFTDDMTLIAASDYTNSRGNWQLLQNLGVSDSSMTVWPIDYTKYTATTARSKGPYLEYSVPLKKGSYQIVVRCLPTFPITTSNDLVVGMAMGTGSVTTASIKCNAETNRWSDNVMYGYSEARFTYKATAEKEYQLRIYAMNPAIVVSQIMYRQMDDVEDGNLAPQLMVNPDFEQYKSGNSILTNTDGSIRRGVPYGWTLKGTLNGNSYGINKDESIKGDDSNLCWIKSKPMPEDCELYQTVPAEKLTPGIYEVGCWLWVQSGKRGSCRLFANDHVQYYAYKHDYDQILKEDEVNTFAGYKAGYETHTIMHPMRVVLKVQEGEDLRLGIKTSCISNAGTQTDETGWFKVDHFTIRRLANLPTTDPDSLTQELLVNPDFEYKDAETLAEGRSILNAVPYGWQMSYTGNYTMTTSGIYGKGEGMHGQNYCAFTPSGYRPIPEDFCLYQTIPASKLKANTTYRVSCLFWSEKGLEGQGRLFANNQVQYFSTPRTYLNNLTEGETPTFASYTDGVGINATAMQELSVLVTVAEGEDLTLGIRSGCRKSDGKLASGTDRTGKFRVDYFRIEEVETNNDATVGIDKIQNSKFKIQNNDVYDLAGRKVQGARGKGQEDSSLFTLHSSLKKGIYIVNGKKYIIH